jgi:predicted small secreted protein
MKLKLLSVALLSLFFITNGYAQSSPNEKNALEYIKNHASEFKIKENDNFSLRFVRNSLAGETLRFQHMINNVPVYNSEIVINFNKNNEVAFSSTSYNESVNAINTQPSISSEVAVNLADKQLNYNEAVTFQESKLYVYDFNGTTKLVYRVVTSAEDLMGSWEAIIDANTSDVLSLKDVAIYCGTECTDSHNHLPQTKATKAKHFAKVETTSALAFETGTAMVFLSDPLSGAGVTYGGNYVDGNGQGDTDTAELNAQRVLVNLPQVENVSGTYKLKSSYVEIKNLENPNKGLFTQANANFLFTRSQDGFEAANVFYHTDNSLRYINETLGVTCLPLTNAGVLWFDPSGANGADNSYYTNGRVVFGEGCVDDGEDGDVIWHELAHGLHDWITGGSLSQVNGLSEGTGDYWAQSHSRALGQWTSAQPAYHWMFSWDGHNPCWGGRTTNYGALYPGGLVGQVHTDGQIWATVNMKIWDVLGRTKTDTAFLEGLAMTNSSTNQQNAAIAVRQAAINMNYSCADVKVMTEKYTAAGYTMPAIPLTINCPGTQTVIANGAGNYVVPSFASITNAINSNCNAVVTQTPAIGSTVAVGSHTVTMTATSGTAVNCNFTLIVQAPLGLDDVVRSSIVIYPNPAKSNITIKGDFTNAEKISVYNMLGQKVMDSLVSGSESNVDISKLSNGIYTIQFNDSKATYKFVKE